MKRIVERAYVQPTRIARPSPRYAMLRAGARVDVDAWGSARVEARQRMRAVAVHDAGRGAFAFSHETAAAMHGLPLVGRADERVHTTPLSAHPPKSHGDVIRHKRDLRASDLTLIDGHLVTSLDRTVFDLVRALRLEGGLAVMDAALHLVGWDDDARSVDPEAAEAFRALVRSRIERAGGARGIRNARICADLGDPAAQSPGESRSRLMMWSNRMPLPELQLPVRTQVGLVFLDFAWPTLGAFGEFDGAVKLLDPGMRGDRTAAEVIAAQGVRRQAVQDATGWRPLHWGWDDTADPDAYWRRITAQGWDPRWRL